MIFYNIGTKESFKMLLTIDQNKIPFSVLTQTAIELGAEDSSVDDARVSVTLMGTLGTLQKLEIPGTKFFLQSYVNLHLETDPQVLPEEVPETAPVGVIVAMNGEEWVVIEVAEEWFMWLAPASYIDITK